MQRSFVMAAALIVGFGCGPQAVGQALSRDQSSIRPSPLGDAMAEPASSPNLLHRERRGLKPGVVVKDRHGATVGLITKVDQSKDGQPAVQLDVNGTPITVLVSQLRLARRGDQAVISLTRSQIRTSAILNTR